MANISLALAHLEDAEPLLDQLTTIAGQLTAKDPGLRAVADQIASIIQGLADNLSFGAEALA